MVNNRRLTFWGRRRVWLAWIAIALFVGYFALWLFLRSSGFASFLEDKLRARTGIEWVIGETSWNGFDHFSLHDIHFSTSPEDVLGEDILFIEKLSIDIQLARFLPALESIEVLKPQGVVSPETLKGLMAILGDPSPAHVGSPTQATTTDTAENLKSPRADEGNKAQPPTATRPAPAANGSQPKEKKRITGSDAKMIIRGGELIVKHSEQANSFFEVREFDAEIPFSGEDREGQVSWGSMRGSFEDIIWEPVQREMVVKYADKKISIEATLSTKNLVKSEVSVEAHPRRAFPFRLKVAFPEQELLEQKVLSGRLQIEAQKMAGELQIGGALRLPKTWRMNMNYVMENFKVKDNQRKQDFHFYDLKTRASLNHRGITLQDIRAVGETFSFLGNAALLRSGPLAGRFRIYANDQAAGYLTYHLYGLKSFYGSKPWMEPSETPERLRRDIEIAGTVEKPWIDIGYDHKWMPLQDFLAEAADFWEKEMAEEKRK